MTNMTGLLKYSLVLVLLLLRLSKLEPQRRFFAKN